MNGLSTSGNADYVKFRGGRDALGPVFPLFAPCDCRGHLQPGYVRAERHLRHPDVGPVQGRNPLGPRFLRRFRLAGTVEGDRLANERLEGGLVNFFSFVNVDCAAYVSVETRVEETGRILQRRALGEGKLHDILVGFASAEDAVVRPNRSAHPLPLLDDVWVCFLDELAHSAEGFPAPVPEFGDSVRDEFRCRLALARTRLFHVLILEVPEIFHLQSKSRGFLSSAVHKTLAPSPGSRTASCRTSAGGGSCSYPEKTTRRFLRNMPAHRATGPTRADPRLPAQSATARYRIHSGRRSHTRTRPSPEPIACVPPRPERRH